MGDIRWYKRDPRAALVGMAGLTLEECGAYNTILDLIYCNDGAVPNDVRWIAGNLRVDIRVAKRLISKLLHAGKLYVHADTIRNLRADDEVREALERIAAAARAGLASAEKREFTLRVLKGGKPSIR